MTGRVVPEGKHLSLEGRPFRVRGSTYGSFRPRHDGELFPDRHQIGADFEAMAKTGLNTVRTYMLPPADLLSIAEENGLRVLAGIDYPDWRMQRTPGRQTRKRILEDGRRAVLEALERCAFDPTVLGIAVGNEIPADLVRLHGARAVEDTLSELLFEIHSADPAMPATYVNYPGTEYLQIDGQDIISFNVFLEERDAFRGYLKHLQIVSGERPLLITELGLGSELHGEVKQAEAIDWQLREVDESGCSGATVFSWTDDWSINGESVQGWGFGITDIERRPKPAFKAVRRWARRTLSDLRTNWPAVSIIVCARNEEAVIEECLESLERIDYPGLEIIVCDDGSTDETAEIARRFRCRVLKLSNVGLAAARNAGAAAASGEIVAFLDADAVAHSEWPYYLALSIEDEKIAATGGPNFAMPDESLTERAVDHSPGVPRHVLVADDRAEHVAGCNMAIRKRPLDQVGGFDPVFTEAGDDVDICWKLLDGGFEIAFSPAAQVRHHRRNSVRDFIRQQRGYGRAERLLFPKHSHRFDRFGQAKWSGEIYGGPRVLPTLLRPKVYHGSQGMAPYQPIVRRRAEALGARFAGLIPFVFVAALFALMLTVAIPHAWMLSAAAGALILAYGYSVASALSLSRDEQQTGSLRLLVGLLHVLQPIARLWGRAGYPALRPGRAAARWTGDRGVWLTELQRDLQSRPSRVKRGGTGDAWDLEVSVGPFIAARVTAAVTGGWIPLYRYHLRPRPAAIASLLLAPFSYFLGIPAFALALALVAGVVIVESALLSMLVRGSLSNTTSGAAKRSGKPLPAGRSLWMRVIGETRKFRLQIGLLVFLQMLVVPLWLAAPFPIKIVVDHVIGDLPLPSYFSFLPAWATESDFRLLASSAAALVAVVLLIQIQQLFVNIIQTRTGERMTLGLRARLFDHLQQLRFSVYDKRNSKDALGRITDDAPGVQGFVVGGLLPVFGALLMIASLLGGVWLIDWRLTAIAGALAAVLLLLTFGFGRWMRSRRSDFDRIENRALGIVHEALGRVAVIKPSERRQSRQRFVHHSERNLQAQVRDSVGEGVAGIVLGVVTAAGMGMLLVQGAQHAGAGAGGITLGQLLLALAYVTQLHSPVQRLANRALIVRPALKSASRAFQLLTRPQELPERPRAKSIHRAHGELEFVDVSFAYNGRKALLNKVSFAVPPRTRVGITGKAASVKIVLTNLLTRFYDPTEGQVLLDGVDLREYRLSDIRSQISVVSPDAVLPSTTIAENIGYGRPEATMADIVAAAKAANAHGFILNLPDGYQTKLGETEVKLNHGEAQRLAIARAFLRNAPVLILYEPQDLGDGESRESLEEAMDRVTKNRTALVITDRAAALEASQMVLTIEDGHIATKKATLPEEKPVTALVPAKIEAKVEAGVNGRNTPVVKSDGTGPPREELEVPDRPVPQPLKTDGAAHPEKTPDAVDPRQTKGEPKTKSLGPPSAPNGARAKRPGSSKYPKTP
jgi:ABC-type multidrug transport system fused ATPase/permease subunit/GT2 family glycosyltransferase